MSAQEPQAVDTSRPLIEAPGEASIELPVPSIRVRHLWHRFGRFEVLRDVSFDVYPGEIYGFIGPNGAGKTTTIRVMATLLEPMAGRVEIDGIDVTVAPEEVRRAIGYMPDHAGVYDRITVREYLEFFADAFRVPSASVVDAVLELTDLGKLQERLVVTMSKGMKQRLQLARILLHDPKVLILDEPASDLDPRARIEIRDLLVELKSLGKTIFLSSHILTELSDVCTSIGILERGHLVVTGPIDEIGQRLEAQRAAQYYAEHGIEPPPPGQPPPQGPPPQGQPQPGAGPAMPAAAAAAAGAVGVQQAPPQPPYPQQGYGHPGYGAHPGYGGYPYQGHPPPPGVYATKRKVKLRVLGDPRHAAYLIHGGPGIANVDLMGATVVVEYEGNESKVAEIVQHLVHNQVGVIGVEQERNELERIFLEVTRGDVQ